MIILKIILCGIFVILAVIHFVWAFGVQWGFDIALPTNEHGERMINPKKSDCIIVGLGLSAFALFYLLRSNIILLNVPFWVFRYGGWVIPSIFIIRAIGDFKYIGFFKKIRNTDFGQMDTKCYSPLCLLIGLIGVIIQIIK
jgi:hypothetical protein